MNLSLVLVVILSSQDNSKVLLVATHTSPTTDVRCKRKVYIDLPYCWQHLDKDKQLKIKPSGIANARKGLLAFDGKRDSKIVFKSKQIISNYDGEHISKSTLIQRYRNKTAPYGIKLSDDNYEDEALHRGVSTLPNHTSSRFTNVKLVAGRIDGLPSAKVRATKYIINNKNIFINYGKDYKMSEQGVNYSTRYKK